MPDFVLTVSQTMTYDVLITDCATESAARQAWIDGDVDDTKNYEGAGDPTVLSIEELS